MGMPIYSVVYTTEGGGQFLEYSVQQREWAPIVRHPIPKMVFLIHWLHDVISYKVVVNLRCMKQLPEALHMTMKNSMRLFSGHCF